MRYLPAIRPPPCLISGLASVNDKSFLQQLFVGQQQTSHTCPQVLRLVSLCKGVAAQLAARTVALLVGTVGCFVLQELS